MALPVLAATATPASAADAAATPQLFEIVLSDGTVLRADVYKPTGPGSYPVLLVRTPYSKSSFFSMPEGITTLERMIADGFAVVFQDVRGTGASDGQFVPLLNEREDGAATLTALLQQPWCDGRISTLGSSYLGFTQFAMTVEAGAPVRDSVYINTAPDAYTGWYYSPGGAFSVENSDRYAFAVGAGAARTAGDLARAEYLNAIATKESDRLRDGGRHTADVLAVEAPWFTDIVEHRLRDEYWQEISYADDFDQVTAGGLHIGGWFDFFSRSAVSAYTALRQGAASAAAREGQYLVMGPWTHNDTSGVYEAHDFGAGASAASLGLENLISSFLTRQGNTEALPRATWFLMGADEWRTSTEFPPPGTLAAPLFLAPAVDDSGARLAPQAAITGSSVLVPFDVANPVSTRGGRLLSIGDTWTDAGPTDQRVLEARDDVVSFTTEMFETATEVVGALQAVVYVSTHLPDTDVAVVVTDVAPDGTSRLLCEGIGRLSLRDGVDHEAPVDAEQIHRLVIDLGVTANAFAPGHQLRINVAGSNFPNYELNPALADGHQPGAFTVHTGGSWASHVLVPVAPSS
ncbi:CocE/NonD family hydrolase [Kineococcus arenarius]|uniref:CocE/NonD family hydrolase n=1 Tax=Kineococcus sp. SYSU DK007 TaxID=3383128 RepID=UPI003D7D7CA4